MTMQSLVEYFWDKLKIKPVDKRKRRRRRKRRGHEVKNLEMTKAKKYLSRWLVTGESSFWVRGMALLDASGWDGSQELEIEVPRDEWEALWLESPWGEGEEQNEGQKGRDS